MVQKHVLSMVVSMRLLGRELPPPTRGDTLFSYAAKLEVQYCQARLAAGPMASQQARELSRALVRLLGLPQAAGPLPPALLALLVRHPVGPHSGPAANR
jgi:hypothetical protein